MDIDKLIVEHPMIQNMINCEEVFWLNEKVEMCIRDRSCRHNYFDILQKFYAMKVYDEGTVMVLLDACLLYTSSFHRIWTFWLLDVCRGSQMELFYYGGHKMCIRDRQRIVCSFAAT